MTLSSKQAIFIRLLLRSQDQGDGWRAVSELLEPFATEVFSEEPELYERETGYIRLSEEGQIVAKYL